MTSTGPNAVQRKDYRPGPLRRVELAADGRRWALTFGRDFPQARAAVWAALTEPDELLEWAPYTADRNLAAVGPATLLMIDGEDRTEIDGVVTACDAPELLEHAFGGDVLRWQLDEFGDGTRLTLTHLVAEKDSAAMMAAGWHICLDVAERALAGASIGRIVGAVALDYGWAELNARYAAELGTDPATPPPSS